MLYARSTYPAVCFTSRNLNRANLGSPLCPVPASMRPRASAEATHEQAAQLSRSAADASRAAADAAAAAATAAVAAGQAAAAAAAAVGPHVAGAHAHARAEERLVLVASKNPAKVAAVEGALGRCFPGVAFRIQPVDAPSGVPAQPFGSEQTLRGALNRVQGALHAAAAAEASPTASAAGTARLPGGTLVVALEGGLEWVGDAELHCFAWAVVQQVPLTSIAIINDDPADNGGPAVASSSSLSAAPSTAAIAAAAAPSKARSGSFLLPPALAALVAQGMELGEADDTLFGRKSSGRGTGTIGHLTDGLITRSAFYEHALMLALVPYMQPHLYLQQNGQTPD